MNTYKLGKQNPKLDLRTLRCGRYFTPELPTPPDSLDLSSAVSGGYPMDGNDQFGDCGFAGLHHHIQTLRANANQDALPLTEQDVIDAYFAFTGGADSGVVLLDVLNKWNNEGFFGTDTIGAFASVNIQNQTEVKQAINLFGGLYCGVELPLDWQGKDSWLMPSDLKGDNAPGSWGGHCVFTASYDSGGVTVVSWGTLIYVSWDAWDAYFSEAYAVLDSDWFKSDGISPTGLDMDALKDDLSLVS